MAERWPPTYDADELAEQIRDLRVRRAYESFFSQAQTAADRCQGDIISLNSGAPFIDETSQPAAQEHPGALWMVIGNTCDFQRDLDDLPWTQIAPILELPDGAADRQFLSDLQAYRASRYFYVPDWCADPPERHFMVELARPVTVDKRAVLAADVNAQLSRFSWILLHACLVRFLARDDGRFDG